MYQNSTTNQAEISQNQIIIPCQETNVQTPNIDLYKEMNLHKAMDAKIEDSDGY